MRRSLRAWTAAAGLLALGGCNWYYNTLPSPDDLMKLVPWFDHMVKSPAVHPYKRADLPRLTVPGTVPVNGTEPDWAADWTAGNWAPADRIPNPTDPAATLVVGDSLYHIYCTVCHGPAGAADGPVSPKIGAPSLLTEKARGLSDGHVYSLIRYGRGVMPRYGDKIVDQAERWAIVNYVRKLQADATPAGAGGTP
jgi:mono/diheme cytochrome c family protein